ncbi:MAG: hypothetical protein DI529_17345 [Chryseobacterium sp.]|nr:MAG: hypothetical protein DI529_17345 [Chryseobacterium sp.]
MQFIILLRYEHRRIIKKIYLEGEIDSTDCELKDDGIFWTDIYGTENHISKFNIAHNNEIYAWYETNDVGIDKFKIKLKENVIVEWRPPINTMGFSWGGCNFFQFYENFLIVSYRDKHGDIVNIINLDNFDIKKFSFDGFRKTIEMNDNEVIIKELYMDSDKNNYKLTILQNEIVKEIFLK